MDIPEVNRVIDELERQWFEATRMAKATAAELRASAAGTAPETLMAAGRRLAEAEHLKQAIMRQIEALEDGLIT
jgi:hypothetical protein